MSNKILIVDDDANIRKLVRLSLEVEDFEIHEAPNGEEGLIKAREIIPDLIVLDLMMPDKWGYAVCEELKSDPATSDILVIFLTARDGPTSKKMGEMKGGDDFMVKPFDPSELRDRVKKLLGLL